MRKPIKLYLDKVYNDGNNGETIDSAKIYYNFEKIDKMWFDRFIDSFATHNSSSIIMQAGRFIVLISMEFDRNKQRMVIMDLHNDEAFAKRIANEKDGEEKDTFMEAFYSTSRTYEQEFAKFVLVEGSLPNEAQ